MLPDLEQKLSRQVSIFTGVYALQAADEVSGEVVIRRATMIQATVVTAEVLIKKSLSDVFIVLKRCVTSTNVHIVCVFCWALFHSNRNYGI